MFNHGDSCSCAGRIKLPSAVPGPVSRGHTDILVLPLRTILRASEMACQNGESRNQAEDYGARALRSGPASAVRAAPS